MIASEHSMVASLVQESGRPALVDCDAGWTLTDAELREVVEHLASQMCTAGVRPGDGVAIVMANSAATVAVFLAATRVGAVAMPVNPQLRQREIEAIFGDKRPAVVIVGEEGHPEAIATARAQGLPVQAVADARRPALDGVDVAGCALPDVESDAVALLLHTSGTTSRPKAVPLRQRNLTASARATAPTA